MEEFQHIQYIIVACIVLGIIIWQVYSFIQNYRQVKRLKEIYPKENHVHIHRGERGFISIINDDSLSEDFQQPLDDVNSYLSKNRNKSVDYHIIKEIVNRNAEETEEEVDTMLSAPLYLGLMATIAGVAIGVVFFAWKDLANLLTGESLQVDGIKTLLTDIGIAMVASFLGVLFTKILTAKFKEAKAEMSKNKGKFLTWIQTELMPNLTDDLTGALIKMTQDLNNFNSTFADNTKELKETLSMVSDDYKEQVKVLEAIEKLKISKIATANIEVYDKLQGCTTVLGNLSDCLSYSEQYLHEVVALNQQLGAIEKRTRSFEELGNYFKEEIQFVNDRQGMMRQSISSLDSVLQEALSNLGDGVGISINALTESFQKQNQRVSSLIEEQQNYLSEALVQQQMAINQKMSEFEDPFSGLNDVFVEFNQKAKQGIDMIVATFEQQNEAITQMLQNQKETLETELSEHRMALQQKISEFPNHQLDLAEVVKVMEALNANLNLQNEELKNQRLMMQQFMNKDTCQDTNSKMNKWLKIAMACGVSGSFFMLLIILVIKLFELNM